MNTQVNKSLLFIFATFLLLQLTACVSPEKLLDSGEYDQAILLGVKKLKGKKKKKQKYVLAVEEAFARVTARDMRAAASLEKEGRPGNWPKINQIYRNIQRRQDRITPLLPLVAAEGYKADFKFVRVGDLEKESREKAAEYLYTDAQQLLEQGTKGDKLAAREAYAQLEKINQYFSNYKTKGDFKIKH